MPNKNGPAIEEPLVILHYERWVKAVLGESRLTDVKVSAHDPDVGRRGPPADDRASCESMASMPARGDGRSSDFPWPVLSRRIVRQMGVRNLSVQPIPGAMVSAISRQPRSCAAISRTPNHNDSNKRTGFECQKWTPAVIRLALESATAERCDNHSIAKVNDHEVRISTMTEAYTWHCHPDSHETFLALEGGLFIDFDDHTVTLLPGHMLTVIPGVPHQTRPIGQRSVNLTFERAKPFPHPRTELSL